MDQKTTEPRSPVVCIATKDEFCAYAYKLNQDIGGSYVVRLLRGTKMLTSGDLYDEFAAALQFPCYFGENWNAFDECLTDLEWLPGSGYVLLIMDSLHVLSNQRSELGVFMRIIRDVAIEWRKTRDMPFHVLFQCIDADVSTLTAAMGDDMVDVVRLAQVNIAFN